MSIVVFEKITDVRAWSEGLSAAGHAVGFVPTMGALHAGHISLINRAKDSGDKVVVSIFVNPTQFNNSSDLANYPRTYDQDLALLKDSGCDVLFFPSVAEIYPKPEKRHWDFGLLSTTLEGYYRPGHFDGMLTVVQKLLEIVKPAHAYFGEKDFQQLSLIRSMVRQEKIPVEIVGCPIIRESDGLAMSSRNMRLKPEQRDDALAINRVLFDIRERTEAALPRELAKEGFNRLKDSKGVVPEYFEIVNARTFEPLEYWPSDDDAVALVAAYVGEIRLIDNMVLKKMALSYS